MGVTFVPFHITRRCPEGLTCSFFTCFWHIVLTSAAVSSWNLTFLSLIRSVAVACGRPVITAFSHEPGSSSWSEWLSSATALTFLHLMRKWFRPPQFEHVLPQAGHFSFSMGVSFHKTYSHSAVGFPFFLAVSTAIYSKPFRSWFPT